ISGRVGLTTVDWILSKAGIALLVAVPVIFQPELRRILEQLGRGRFFSRPFTFLLREEDVSRFIDELGRTVEMLSQRRIGGLLVIEQQIGLREYMETGVPVDSILSSEMVLNIFFPNSPLHDGAIILRDDRIAAASCYLPLTDRPFLSKELGTRHRAALGITEDSDAVVLVVSEESGSISVAYEGKLTRHLERKQIQEILEELLLQEEKREPFFKPRR
ncbi:MAG: TIGR00159 family protein, partial [Clostridia bacterium]|nr:TIGR00159 family protein [Clostridia bacterium]